jgi:hypothetical protein
MRNQAVFLTMIWDVFKVETWDRSLEYAVYGVILGASDQAVMEVVKEDTIHPGIEFYLKGVG